MVWREIKGSRTATRGEVESERGRKEAEEEEEVCSKMRNAPAEARKCVRGDQDELHSAGFLIESDRALVLCVKASIHGSKQVISYFFRICWR